MDMLSRKSTHEFMSFRRCSFVHERRTANIDAYCLARSSLFLSVGRHVWFGDPPDGVVALYHNDI
jgi:hypothetical protein